MAFAFVAHDGLTFVRCAGLASLHAFSTRSGGVSEGAFASLNLGLSSGDDRERVLENRERFRRAGGFRGPIQVGHQVHGAVVNAAPLAPGTQGDALVTAAAGVSLGVFVADCVPLLLEDSRTGAVAAVHAGWRGTAARVAAAAAEAMQARYGTRPGDLVAAIGPSIKGCCYQVGREVVAALGDLPDPAAFVRHAGENATVDLQEANRQILAAAGVGTIHLSGMCTHCDSEHFFSYRRDGERSGRMLAAIEARPL